MITKSKILVITPFSREAKGSDQREGSYITYAVIGNLITFGEPEDPVQDLLFSINE